MGLINRVFMARMEATLALYSLPSKPLHPVTRYDKRPCFLMGDAIAP